MSCVHTTGMALARERPHMVRAGCDALHDTMELQRVPAMLARDGRLAALFQLVDGRLRTGSVRHCAQPPPLDLTDQSAGAAVLSS